MAERNPRLTCGDIIALSIVSMTGQVALRGKVVWATRKGFRRHEVGLTFGEPTESLRRDLNRVMRDGANTYIVYDGGLKK